ncbi:hypothetical protein AAG570_009367 [Ranatra chinensis]|uniref:Uncharacterized protein n=1 Tax=Ranatra chinensis TaxID=642074 RepID=A0ABD0YNW1_9HEMI
MSSHNQTPGCEIVQFQPQQQGATLTPLVPWEVRTELGKTPWYRINTIHKGVERKKIGMELTEDCRYIIFPFMLLLLSFGGCNAVQGESLVHINSNRIVQVVSERFLSLSIDPEHLLWATPLRRWMSVNEFASRAQADLIVSLNTKQTSRGVWDTRNVVKLISFSNQNRYDIAWQLGYDKYSFGQFLSGTEIGMNAIRLRKILDAFDQYSGSPILAPDVVLSEENIPFLREFVSAASSSIAAIPLQMNAAKSNEEEPLQRTYWTMAMLGYVRRQSFETNHGESESYLEFQDHFVYS